MADQPGGGREGGCSIAHVGGSSNTLEPICRNSVHIPVLQSWAGGSISRAAKATFMRAPSIHRPDMIAM